MKENESVVLIDVYNLLHRMYYVHKALKNSKGEHTGTVYGFFSMLSYYASRLKTNNFILVWDVGGDYNWRRDIYPDYKSNRRSVERTEDQLEDYETIQRSKKIVWELAQLFGFISLIKQGCEADDLIGLLVKKHLRRNIKIISMDKDFLQLVNDKDKIRLYRPGLGRGSYKIYNEKEVENEYNVKAKDFSLLLALTGDKVDGIPGLKGYGNKTAAKLINSVESNKSENILKKLNKEQKKTFERNMVLVDLSIVPINIEINNFRFKKKNLQKAQEIFNYLEFRKLKAKSYIQDNRKFKVNLLKRFL